MPIRRIHLIAPAGACRPFLDALGLSSARDLVDLMQRMVGSNVRLTADLALLDAAEDANKGGRTDDSERAADIQGALGEDDVAAILAIRGGAWFSRILPRIDFTVLDRRRTRVAVLGFSELTPLVNIVAAHPMGVGIYDSGPAFLTYGLKRFGHRQSTSSPGPMPLSDHAVRARLQPEMEAYLRDVIRIITGVGTARGVTASIRRGSAPDRAEVSIVGGNLTLLSVLIGSKYASCIEPNGRWLLIEDYNDKLERFDRFLAHLTLAGYWERSAGVLLGDFHRGYEDLSPAVLETLAYHVPDPGPPVFAAPSLGHVWPMSPLPLNLPLTIERQNDDTFAVHWDPKSVQTISERQGGECAGRVTEASGGAPG